MIAASRASARLSDFPTNVNCGVGMRHLPEWRLLFPSIIRESGVYPGDGFQSSPRRTTEKRRLATVEPWQALLDEHFLAPLADHWQHRKDQQHDRDGQQHS